MPLPKSAGVHLDSAPAASSPMFPDSPEPTPGVCANRETPAPLTVVADDPYLSTTPTGQQCGRPSDQTERPSNQRHLREHPFHPPYPYSQYPAQTLPLARSAGKAAVLVVGKTANRPAAPQRD